MKNNILYILFLLPAILSSQTLSIQDLWNKLAETNILKQKQLDLQIARQELAIEKLNRYPVVYGEVNLQRNLIIPTTPVPAIAFDPKAQDGAILPLKFATKWNTRAGLQAEWNIFEPNRSSKIKEKILLTEKTEINKKLEQQNLKKDATLAYTSIVLASLQHQAAIEDSIRYQQILRITKLRFEAGRDNANQYFIAQEEYERKKIQLYETWSVLREADLELQKYVDLYAINQLSSDINNIINALKEYEAIDYEPELNAIDIRRNDNEYQSIKRQLLPTFTLNAFYGSQFFNNSLNLTNSKQWFGNSYTNIAVKLPLTAYLIQSPTLKKTILERELNTLKLLENNKINNIQNLQKIQKIHSKEQKIESLKKLIFLSLDNIEQQRMEYEAEKLLLDTYNKTISSHSSILKELWQTQYELISLILN